MSQVLLPPRSTVVRPNDLPPDAGADAFGSQEPSIGDLRATHGNNAALGSDIETLRGTSNCKFDVVPEVDGEESRILMSEVRNRVEGDRQALSSTSIGSHGGEAEKILVGSSHGDVPDLESGPSQFQAKEKVVSVSVATTCAEQSSSKRLEYGPPSLTRNASSIFYRATSSICTLFGLSVLFVATGLKATPRIASHIWASLTLRDPDSTRPFIEEERRLKRKRKADELAWRRRANGDVEQGFPSSTDGFIPTAGGPDPLTRDVGHYARCVGLDVEKLKVTTSDGFVLDLWHIYDPAEFTPTTAAQEVGTSHGFPNSKSPAHSFNNIPGSAKKKKYPVLMIHGLLQSSGTYCTNDDNSLAFYLAKSGYDIWLGNNRCGFNPEHSTFSPSDPRMWSWTIEHMGTLDLPALATRILSETGLAKLALIGHSQGTTQTFLALSTRHCASHSLNSQLSLFCALAPAAYAGTWLKRPYFAFVRDLSARTYNLFFGVHGFAAAMIAVGNLMPAHFFAAAGYRVFNFLFGWSDWRWDRGVRDRCFIFAPVWVSAKSMGWWLGKGGFAERGCVLGSREEVLLEDEEDERFVREGSQLRVGQWTYDSVLKPWYGPETPPMALWVSGCDSLVDGRKLLRRLERREPHVRVVHAKVLEDYEHLDVIWAMDSIEKVGKELRDCIWRTVPEEIRESVRVPKGCEKLQLEGSDRAFGS